MVQLHCETSGAEALKWISNSKVLPDLILLDCMMPGMSGNSCFCIHQKLVLLSRDCLHVLYGLLQLLLPISAPYTVCQETVLCLHVMSDIDLPLLSADSIFDREACQKVDREACQKVDKEACQPFSLLTGQS